MTPLRDYFSKGVCNEIRYRFGFEYVEQLQAIPDKDIIMGCRGIGKKFIEKLRAINTGTVPLRKRNTTVVVTGLTVRQRNAMIKAFQSGAINELLNERYMADIFKADQIQVIPEIVTTSEEEQSYVKYINEN